MKLTPEQKQALKIYEAYQTANLGNGYLLIGIGSSKKNGKYRMKGYPNELAR